MKSEINYRMVGIIDLKKSGIIQDVKEIKEKKTKEKSSSYYNPKLERKKLALMKESYGIKYKVSDTQKEYKKLAQDIVKREKEKISGQEAIERQQKKIREKSFIGRAERGVGRLGEKVYRTLNKRVIARRVLKPSQTTVTIS